MNWLDQICAELEKIEPDDGDVPMLTRPDSPRFLKNAERIIANAVAPAFRWKPGMTFTAARVGAILGHKIAYVKPFAEGLRISKQFNAKTPPEVVEHFEDAEREILAYHPIVLRTARRCLAIALRQSLKDAAEFVSGMHKALQKGSVDARGSLVGANTATEFYWVVLCIGPRLQYEVRSLAHMHELCRRWFGQRAGDLKTTEKRCARIELSFGRKAGQQK